MKSIVIALALTLTSLSAFAYEAYSSTAELPAGSAVEALYTQDNRPVCPPDTVVAKKYCWSKANHWFVHCGYFCNSTEVPKHEHH